MEDIEDWYKQQEEIIENEFFEDVKKGKNQKKAIEDYRAKLKRLIEEYNKKYSKNLKIEKEKAKKIKKKEIKKERVKPFKAEHIELRESFTERQKRKISNLFYKINRKIKLIYYKYFPNFLIYSLYKTKRTINYLISVVFEAIYSIYNSIKNLLARIIKSIVGILVFIFKSIKEKITRIIKFLKDKMPKKKQEEVQMNEAEKKVLMKNG